MLYLYEIIFERKHIFEKERSFMSQKFIKFLGVAV